MTTLNLILYIVYRFCFYQCCGSGSIFCRTWIRIYVSAPNPTNKFFRKLSSELMTVIIFKVLKMNEKNIQTFTSRLNFQNLGAGSGFWFGSENWFQLMKDQLHYQLLYRPWILIKFLWSGSCFFLIRILLFLDPDPAFSWSGFCFFLIRILLFLDPDPSFSWSGSCFFLIRILLFLDPDSAFSGTGFCFFLYMA